MDLPARAEANFVAYLRHALPAGLAIRAGRDGGTPPHEDPFLVVHASSAVNHPDLPPADGNYQLELTLTLRAPAGPDQDWPQELDGHLEQIQCAMGDLSAAQTFMNAPASAATPSTRPAGPFHLYEIEPLTVLTDTENNQWVETRTYRLTCVAADG